MKINPCKECGYSAEVTFYDSQWGVVCSNCHRGVGGDTIYKAGAVEAWNIENPMVDHFEPEEEPKADPFDCVSTPCSTCRFWKQENMYRPALCEQSWNDEGDLHLCSVVRESFRGDCPKWLPVEQEGEEPKGKRRMWSFGRWQITFRRVKR